jgi:hypothetical protein
MQLVAGRYIRSPLDPAAIRDLRLLILLLEIDKGRFSRKIQLREVGFAYNAQSSGRLASLAGISRDRVAAGITRLVEAGVLLVEDGVDPCLVFAERVLHAAGAPEHIDWSSILPRLEGQTPSLVVLQVALEMMRVPWEWTSLAYEALAERAYYSLGMVRHGMSQLLTAGVLERSSHSGRSHEYRCSSVALYGAPRYADLAPATPPVRSLPPSVESSTHVPKLTREAVSVTANSPDTVTSVPQATTVVEIGGLVLRVPEGTVITMGVDASGASVYEIGPHMKVKPNRVGQSL